MKRLIRGTVVAAGLMAGGNGQATVVYQSIPDLGAGPGISALCSACGGNGQQAGQRFTLSEAASVGSILFTVDVETASVPVTVSLYADGPGDTVGTLLFSQTYTGFAFSMPTDEFTYIQGVNTPALALGPGTYDLFLSNPVSLYVPGYGGVGLITVQNPAVPLPVGTGYDTGGEMAIALVLQDTPIAEPGSIALFGAGILGLGLIRRKWT